MCPGQLRGKLACALCGLLAPDLTLLQRHECRAHAAGEEPSYYSCSMCSYRASDASTVRAHERSHTVERLREPNGDESGSDSGIDDLERPFKFACSMCT